MKIVKTLSENLNKYNFQHFQSESEANTVEAITRKPLWTDGTESILFLEFCKLRNCSLVIVGGKKLFKNSNLLKSCELFLAR